ncbi:MAG TPA: MFS transporter [Solirubrobacteraceae bacterium]|nr:MFS transporter [Solirubrobacteraceae bacterium]
MSRQNERVRRYATMGKLGRTPAFWLLAVTLAAFLFASSAPSPLYVVYQQKWGFSAIVLTAVFATYALGLLAALVVAGSVSDHLGRRPTLLFSLAVEIVAMLLFAEARSVAWLFAARLLQGFATGVATAGVSAALIDLQPGHRPRLGALLAASAPMTGLAAGALGSGLLVEYAPEPTRLVYWLLAGVFLLAALSCWAIPETVARRPSWRQSLRPTAGVPPHLRADFLATIPCLTATWALGGLILSLGPSLTARVLQDPSHVAGGLSIFIMAGVSSATSIVLRDAHARIAARGGLSALIVGVALALVALNDGSTALFLVATGVAGLGFGPAFAGAFRAITNRAPIDQRAELVASVYVASYLAYSLPALAAGIAVTQYGLHDTANVYGVALIVLALLALALSHRLQDPESPASARARREGDGAIAVLDMPAPIPGDPACTPEQIQ